MTEASVLGKTGFSAHSLSGAHHDEQEFSRTAVILMCDPRHIYVFVCVSHSVCNVCKIYLFYYYCCYNALCMQRLSVS